MTPKQIKLLKLEERKEKKTKYNNIFNIILKALEMIKTRGRTR